MKNMFCPYCEENLEVEVINTSELYAVRGEEIPVMVQYFQCSVCKQTFDDPLSDDDPIDEVYRMYRRRHFMLQPEEIRQLREKYELTQEDLCLLLGIGVASLSRYENGALQTQAHDNLLQTLKDVHSFIKLLDRKIRSWDDRDVTLQKEKLRRLVSRLRNSSVLNQLSDIQKGINDKQFRGQDQFIPDKFYNLMLYIFGKEEGRVYKTKLNKVLFYCDFVNYLNCGHSISGCVYARAPWGFVPEGFSRMYSLLNWNEIFAEQEQDANGHTILTTREKVNTQVFEPGEIIIIDHVLSFFQHMSSKDISDYSHEEVAYKQTKSGGYISYPKFAKALQKSLFEGLKLNQST